MTSGKLSHLCRRALGVATRPAPKSRIVLSALMLTVLASTFAPGTARCDEPGPSPSFEDDVLSIFKAHCIKCHGSQDTQGGLDLSSAASLMQGSDNGPVILKGAAEKSVLLKKVAARQMPPPKEKDPLGDEQVAIIRRWIDAGAPVPDDAATGPG